MHDLVQLLPAAEEGVNAIDTRRGFKLVVTEAGIVEVTPVALLPSSPAGTAPPTLIFEQCT